AVTTMPEVRAAIDDLDQQIVALLGTRLRYIEAAARIKEDRKTVRDEWRKRDVIGKAVKRAREVGFDAGICESVYETLVEGCIAYEGVRWEEI
ncbi:chorismate mutase, partial [Kalaharituber pfeilii]